MTRRAVFGLNPSQMLDLRRYFGRVVVLNLDSRPDRLEAFYKRMAIAGVTGVERFRAVDGALCHAPAWWRAGNGAWGCLQGHVRICQDALLDGLRSYLVFEDDAVFADDFADRLPGLMDTLEGVEWDQLYLGAQVLFKESYPPCPFRKGLIRGWNFNRTHAFAVNARFMVKFQQHVLHFPDYLARYIAPIPASDGKPEVKEWMPHIDHQLGYLHERKEHVILAANPWLCGQAAGKSDINGGEHETQFWPELGWG